MNKKTKKNVMLVAAVVALLLLLYFMRDKIFKKAAAQDKSADGNAGVGGGGGGVAVPFSPQAPTTTGGSAETPDWQTEGNVDQFRPTMGWTYTLPDGKETTLMGR